jgi:uncharacterized OsmC-like protein
VRARAKIFEYAAALEPTGTLTAPDRPDAELPEGWSPEHLVLVALMRCTATSLRYHAGRSGLAEPVVGASASGRVTKRGSDGRYAFVELECELDVRLEPAPSDDELREVVTNAERDCFVGASLTTPVHYRWRINGQDLDD